MKLTFRFLLLILFIYNCLDAALTYDAVVLQKVAIEVNPVMAWLLSIHPALFLLVKIGLVNGWLLLMYKYFPNSLNKRENILGIICLSFLILLLGFVVLSNCVLTWYMIFYN